LGSGVAACGCLGFAALAGANPDALPVTWPEAGGLSVLLMPKRSVYDQFSDKDQHDWLCAAPQSHKIWPLCH